MSTTTWAFTESSPAIRSMTDTPLAIIKEGTILNMGCKATRFYLRQPNINDQSIFKPDPWTNPLLATQLSKIDALHRSPYKLHSLVHLSAFSPQHLNLYQAFFALDNLFQCSRISYVIRVLNPDPRNAQSRSRLRNNHLFVCPVYYAKQVGPLLKAVSPRKRFGDPHLCAPLVGSPKESRNEPIIWVQNNNLISNKLVSDYFEWALIIEFFSWSPKPTRY